MRIGDMGSRMRESEPVDLLVMIVNVLLGGEPASLALSRCPFLDGSP
jgi:hypothetical protein